MHKWIVIFAIIYWIFAEKSKRFFATINLREIMRLNEKGDQYESLFQKTQNKTAGLDATTTRNTSKRVVWKFG